MRVYSPLYRKMQKKEDTHFFRLRCLLWLLASQLYMYNKVEGGMSRVTRVNAPCYLFMTLGKSLKAL